jgi:hypothetical protein
MLQSVNTTYIHQEQGNILYFVAYTMLFYSNLLVLYTLKIYFTDSSHLLYPYIFLEYLHIFILKIEISNHYNCY